MTKTVYIEGMMCKHCAANVKKALEAIDGITSVDVDIENKKAIVSLSDEIANETIENAIKDEGYTVTKID
ncbi:MAG: heavy-metal-associated domain-containing protein [Clostridiales bacterium]|nr:heavy-metal-associated domain-containing protein [Clostridiales bacterium]